MIKMYDMVLAREISVHVACYHSANC